MNIKRYRNRSINDHFLTLYNKSSHTERVETTLTYYLTVSKGLIYVQHHWVLCSASHMVEDSEAASLSGVQDPPPSSVKLLEELRAPFSWLRSS